MIGKAARIVHLATRCVSASSVPKINAAPVFRGSQFAIRQFSVSDEPEYVVDPDALVNFKKLKVTYIMDIEKQQVYARFISDPVKWDIKALSNFYSMSEERAQAIVYLMHTRYTMMKEKGFNVSIIPEDENEKKDSARGAGPKIVVEIPELWRSLYEFHKEDTSLEPGALLAAYNEKQTAASLKTEMDAGEVKKILENLKDHEARMQNIVEYERHMEEFLSKLQADGANINFQEIKVVSDKARRFEKSYFPRTLHDDEIESETNRLLKRIEQQTRATVNYNLEFYNDTFGDSDIKPKAAKKDSTEKPMRWKMAFRDLDKIEQVRSNLKDKSQMIDTPTLIRTRSGR